MLFAQAKNGLGPVFQYAGARSEFDIGQRFHHRPTASASFWFFTWARWACIPFSLLGGYVCYRWARELYGDWPGAAGAGAVVLRAEHSGQRGR